MNWAWIAGITPASNAVLLHYGKPRPKVLPFQPPHPQESFRLKRRQRSTKADSALSQSMEYAVLLNPIVYMGEGLRVALTPGPPHMPSWLILGALLISLLLGWAGIRGYLRRVIG